MVRGLLDGRKTWTKRLRYHVSSRRVPARHRQSLKGCPQIHPGQLGGRRRIYIVRMLFGGWQRGHGDSFKDRFTPANAPNCLGQIGIARELETTVPEGFDRICESPARSIYHFPLRARWARAKQPERYWIGQGLSLAGGQLIPAIRWRSGVWSTGHYNLFSPNTRLRRFFIAFGESECSAMQKVILVIGQ